jgi:hypothetical protein
MYIIMPKFTFFVPHPFQFATHIPSGMVLGSRRIHTSQLRVGAINPSNHAGEIHSLDSFLKFR